MQNYTIWEMDKLGTEGVRRCICFRMFNRVDDQTMRAIQQSTFMYGFLKGEQQDYGMACWYAVLTDEIKDWVEQLLANGKYLYYAESSGSPRKLP